MGERLAEAFHEAGVSEDVMQNLVLDHDTTGKSGGRAPDASQFGLLQA